MSNLQITFSTPEGNSELLELSADMKVDEAASLAAALLGVDSSQCVLVREQQPLDASKTLGGAGVKNGDFIIVISRSGLQQHQQSNSGAATASATGGSGAAPMSLVSSGRGGPRPPAVPGAKVFWDGMSMDDVLENNTNPEHIVDIFQGNENLLRELNFHNPDLATAMRKDRADALRALRTFMMMNATSSTLNKMTHEKKETEMQRRLQQNANDKEAKEYFEKKEKSGLVQQSYMTMMRDYPEALSRVLMLYIDVEINGVKLQAFVDSGAQTSVISGKCAERCDVLRLTDDRFAGKVVGVGTGQTLGRVHVVPLNIAGNYFPMSLTVMDDSQGLGDSNMEFLLGLDMLKRHRCSIDLAEGKLFFHGVGGRRISTPFLHEHALPESKGGTKDYNPNLVPAEDVTDEESGAGASAASTAGGASASASAGGSGAFDAGVVETLIALGHTRDRVMEALQQTNGDAELAKTVLMFGGGR